MPSRRAKRSREPHGDKDYISRLPSVLLQHIMFFLLAKQALGVRGVAHAWKGLKCGAPLFFSKFYKEMWTQVDQACLAELDKRTVQHLHLTAPDCCTEHEFDFEAVFDLDSFAHLKSCFFEVGKSVSLLQIAQAIKTIDYDLDLFVRIDRPIFEDLFLLMSLTRLTIDHVRRISAREFRAIGLLPHLTQLSLFACGDVEHVSPCESLFPKLVHLLLLSCYLSNYASVTAPLSHLQRLDLRSCYIDTSTVPLHTISDPSRITQLVLDSSHYTQLTFDLALLQEFTSLKHLVCGQGVFVVGPCNDVLFREVLQGLESFYCYHLLLPEVARVPTKRIKALALPHARGPYMDLFLDNYVRSNQLEVLQIGSDMSPEPLKHLLAQNSTQSLRQLILVPTERKRIDCEAFLNLEEVVVPKKTKVRALKKVHVHTHLAQLYGFKEWTARVFPIL